MTTLIEDQKTVYTVWTLEGDGSRGPIGEVALCHCYHKETAERIAKGKGRGGMGSKDARVSREVCYKIDGVWFHHGANVRIQNADDKITLEQNLEMQDMLEKAKNAGFTDQQIQRMTLGDKVWKQACGG